MRLRSPPTIMGGSIRRDIRGKPLDPDRYDASRWIVEPFHLYDCCMENDGATALVLVTAEGAAEFRNKPAYLLGAAVGSGHRAGAAPHNPPRRSFNLQNT